MGENENTGMYIAKIPREDIGLAREVENLFTDCNALYQEDQGSLPRIHFDRHLYQPLLVEANGFTSSPSGLQESERKFVADLRDYCISEPDALPTGAEAVLASESNARERSGLF